ncbi:MAG TPA: DUF488 family protein [Armatimonadota bacterium]|jgi:uncharacterized protein YeaO (DUF488 family)
MIEVRRVYEPALESDGQRVLVDRLWPRGLSKEEAAVDLWLREIAPSDDLREWFGHDPAKWDEFQQRYSQELANQAAALAKLAELAAAGPVTLLFAAKDEKHNNAVALATYLRLHALVA